MKPFEGNLSDDQKLVLSSSDSGTTCMIRSNHDVKVSNEKSQKTCSAVILFQQTSEAQPPPVPPKVNRMNRPKRNILSESFFSDTSSASSESVNTSDNLMSSISLDSTKNDNIGLLPSSLLVDIRNRSLFQVCDEPEYEKESNFSDLEMCNQNSEEEKLVMNFYRDENFYKYHINENLSYELNDFKMTHDESDESFAGLKDLRSRSSTIRSKNGTIRGIKNRVRSGISTFLQMQQTTATNFKDKDGGKVVVYTTSMGIVRSTYAKCQMVKKILRTLMVKFEERDVFMSQIHQQEIRDRMQSDEIDVPQLFVNGQYIGNAAQIERYNEIGELRKMLKTFKCLDSIKSCMTCGGFNGGGWLTCPSCCGSKKSIHRNNFTSEFVALKCMNCDEVGLVRCYSCCS